MVKRKKKNSYELSPEEAKKWKQITIFDAIAAIESRGGEVAKIETKTKIPPNPPPPIPGGAGREY